MNIAPGTVIGSLTFETSDRGLRIASDRFPDHVLICDELLVALAPAEVDIADDEVCFLATNGRALYRRMEHDAAMMMGHYILLGSVGPTDG